MKTVQFIIIALLFAVVGSNSFAQTHNHSKMTASKTESIKVSGNCDMCKARIEKSAKIEGVTKASWDTETKILTLVFDPSKTNSDDTQKKIAAVGHDTEKFKGDDKAYAKLPGCCKYDWKK